MNKIDVCNFVDDTTSFVYHKNQEKLERNSELAIHFVEDNYMKLNTDKWHLVIFGHKYEHQWTQIGKDMVWEENEDKLSRITIDNELNFIVIFQIYELF